jgi:ferredoxin
MIGCPVGSIHRGNNGQIEIQDWCIGCGLCANNCPYGAIQMHDIGVIPAASRGWRFCSPAVVKDAKWYAPSYRDHRWLGGEAPFYYDDPFHDELAASIAPDARAAMTVRDSSIYFRVEFRLASHLIGPNAQFKFALTSTDAAATLWVNGHELQPEKAKAGKRDYWLPSKSSSPAAPISTAAETPTVAAQATFPTQLLRGMLDRLTMLS